MNIKIKHFSSLVKLRSAQDFEGDEINNALTLAGESFSYQLAIISDSDAELTFEVSPELKEFITLYYVTETVMDYPIYDFSADEDYITRTPGTMPDLLVPTQPTNNYTRITSNPVVLWVKVDFPKNYKSGIYRPCITVHAKSCANAEDLQDIKAQLPIEVLPINLPEQKTIFTQWFYTDCIASIHNVEIYCEAHWKLIDKYMHLAAQLGINMILTPAITPALDTDVGSRRPNTQLVKITYENNTYAFDFSLLKKWIDMAHKNGITYFEISHFFSQWGAKYSPNIYVYENGTVTNKFGWHVNANDSRYKEFLEQFLPALLEFLTKENVIKNCYFHISDEPFMDHLESYGHAHSIVKPLLGECRLMDAISNKEFYDTGLMDIPVTASDHIKPFLEDNIENQWVYYCSAQYKKVGNRFLSMPSYRNRILGLQMYKYNIKGFLHWGYNFYYSQLSRFEINPFLDSSSSRAFASGDAFSVYPAKDGVNPSLRAVVFKEALQDIEVCRTLESYIGRDAVIKMIDDAAGMDIDFEEYPRNNNFIPDLINKMKEEIRKYL